MYWRDFDILSKLVFIPNDHSSAEQSVHLKPSRPLNRRTDLSTRNMLRICILLTSAFFTFLQAARPCYTPKGDIRPTHSPCNEMFDESSCCHVDDLCLSNGYCWQQHPSLWGNRIGSSTCTDPTYETENCPVDCLQGEYQAIHHVLDRVELEPVKSCHPKSACVLPYISLSARLCRHMTRNYMAPTVYGRVILRYMHDISSFGQCSWLLLL